MLRRIRAWRPPQAAIACGLVALAGAASSGLRGSFGEVGYAIILLAPPVAIVGWLYGLQTALTAAGLAYLAYALLVGEPWLPSSFGAVGGMLAPPVFILAALIGGGFALTLRAWRREAESWSQTTRAMVEANAFFNVTPNEDAIRQKLAEAVSAMTRSATVVTDRDGRLSFHAGAQSDWTSLDVDDLEQLAGALIRQPRDCVVSSGDYRGRSIGADGEVQGVVIWRDPHAPTSATDEDVDLIAELAATALARSAGDRPVRAGSPLNRSDRFR